MKELICIIIGHNWKFCESNMPDGKLLVERCDRCGYGKTEGQVVPHEVMKAFEDFWNTNEYKDVNYHKVLKIFLEALEKKVKTKVDNNNN